MRVLDDANTWSFIRPGHESSTRSAQLIRRGGLFRESAPGLGRHFWVGRGCFSWGDGGARESVRETSAGSVAGRRALSNSPILLYIIC